MSFILPDLALAPGIRAIITTRDSGNLAKHVAGSGDVDANRERLVREAGLPRQPLWMEQVHGTQVFVPGAASYSEPPQADAAYTRTPNLPLVVMVADCLPVLLASTNGEEIAAVHAGWRGLANGVIDRAIECFSARDIVAWLGPAIGPCHYEVDDVVRREFDADTGFNRGRDAGHFMMDLYAIATAQLKQWGIRQVRGGGMCTACDSRLFSHRRDGLRGDGSAGRIAAIIWKGEQQNS